jgi:hypothetical protein
MSDSDPDVTVSHLTNNIIVCHNVLSYAVVFFLLKKPNSEAVLSIL